MLIILLKIFGKYIIFYMLMFLIKCDIQKVFEQYYNLSSVKEKKQCFANVLL